MTSKYTLPHINVESRRERADFKSASERFTESRPIRDRQQHGALLRAQFSSAVKEFEQDRPSDKRVTPEAGVYLEVELQRNANPDSLEKKRNRLKPASAKLKASGNRIIGLFVPDEAKHVLESILTDYETGDLSGIGNTRRILWRDMLLLSPIG